MTTFLDTADSGHWGPAIAWLLYSVILFWEGLGFTYVLRRRYVEPLFAMVAGGLVAIVHFFVIQKCYVLVTSPSHEWNQERCFSVNGAHIGLGLFTFSVGTFEFVLQTHFWQRLIGASAGPSKHQQFFFIPSIFLMTGFIMMSHEQDTMWQTMIHTFTGGLALIFFILRALSYRFRSLTMAAGVIGMVGCFELANSSESGYTYWMQVGGESNGFGIPVTVPFLTLINGCYALLFTTCTLVGFMLWKLLPAPAQQAGYRCHDALASLPFWHHFERLDLLEEAAAHGAVDDDGQAYDTYGVDHKLLPEDRLEVDENTSDLE